MLAGRDHDLVANGCVSGHAAGEGGGGGREGEEEAAERSGRLTRASEERAPQLISSAVPGQGEGALGRLGETAAAAAVGKAGARREDGPGLDELVSQFRYLRQEVALMDSALFSPRAASPPPPL